MDENVCPSDQSKDQCHQGMRFVDPPRQTFHDGTRKRYHRLHGPDVVAQQCLHADLAANA